MYPTATQTVAPSTRIAPPLRSFVSDAVRVCVLITSSTLDVLAYKNVFHVPAVVSRAVNNTSGVVPTAAAACTTIWVLVFASRVVLNTSVAALFQDCAEYWYLYNLPRSSPPPSLYTPVQNPYAVVPAPTMALHAPRVTLVGLLGAVAVFDSVAAYTPVGYRVSAVLSAQYWNSFGSPASSIRVLPIPLMGLRKAYRSEERR